MSLKVFGHLQKENKCKLKPSYCAGLEIATNTDAKVTNYFSFAEHYVSGKIVTLVHFVNGKKDFVLTC